jgi:rare lipoprotein A
VVTITNLANGRAIRAVVNDCGPFIRGRCVDLGRAGADCARHGRHGKG